MKIIKKIYYIIIFIVDIIMSFHLKKNKILNKTLMIIKTDAIGDYVLFRNFLAEIKNSTQFKDYKITLIGNFAWKEVTDTFDSQYIDNYIWLDRRKFYKNLLYRINLLRQIHKSIVEYVIQPMYSREFLYSETIVLNTRAKYKIGCSSSLDNISILAVKISNKYYTNIIQSDKNVLFEFFRYKDFFSKLLNHKLHTQYSIVAKKTLIRNILPTKYWVLFLGASDIKRKWAINNFMLVGKYIQNKYNTCIVLCGIKDENYDSIKTFADEHTFINLVGQTTLIELIDVVSLATALISNETSVPHFATALGVKTFVVSNGERFGRFTPYPNSLTNKNTAIYPPIIEEYLHDYDYLTKLYSNGSDLDINTIAAETVIHHIDKEFLEQKHT